MSGLYKLRPCPFCGSTKLKVESKHNEYAHTASVRCNKCYARGSTVSGNKQGWSADEATKQKAMELWNDRDICNEDEDFGAILNCAVRYCLGRQTYMPHLVMAYIIPRLPHLSNRTIGTMIRDIENAHSYGDESIDKPSWMHFLEMCREEMGNRDCERVITYQGYIPLEGELTDGN